MKRKGGELAILDNRAIKKAHEEVIKHFIKSIFKLLVIGFERLNQ